MTYWVKPYDGEGSNSQWSQETNWGPFDTIGDARAFISRKVAGQTHGSFDGPFHENDEAVGLLECWHESDQEGCGGYAIYEDQPVPTE
jgi:hypothetical protein